MKNLKNNLHTNEESALIYSNVNNVHPEISFVVTSYNRFATLCETINSIVETSKLFVDNYEIIIIDNKSNNNFIELIKQFLVENDIKNILLYQNCQNVGGIDNMNKGIELSKGKYISIVHDDDLLDKNYYRHIVKCLKLVDEERLGCIKVSFKMFNHGEKLPPLDNENKKEIISFDKVTSIINCKTPTVGPTCGMLFRRDAVFDVGGFDSTRGPSSDQTLGLNLLKNNYQCYVTTNELAYCRVFDNDSSNLNTMIECNKNDHYLRKDIYSLSIFGILFGLLFEDINYKKEIDFWIKHSRKVASRELSVKELDFLNKYKEHPIKNFLLNVIRRIYKKINLLYAK